MELGEAGRVLVDRFGQELQGDRLAELEVVGAIDLAHAAAAEERHQPIASGDDRASRQPSDFGHYRDRGTDRHVIIGTR